MKKIISLGVVLSFTPLLAFAASGFTIINVIANLLNFILPVLIALAVVYFIWGVLQYMISKEEEQKKASRSKIINGLIALFVIIAFWGIIRLITTTFGVGPEQLNSNAIPCIPNVSAGITC